MDLDEPRAAHGEPALRVQAERTAEVVTIQNFPQ